MKKLLFVLAIVLFSCEKPEVKCYHCQILRNGIPVETFNITNPSDNWLERTNQPVKTDEGYVWTECEPVICKK